MTDQKAGLKAAVEEALAGHAPEADPEQLALLPLAPAPGEQLGEGGQVVRRGPGRPAGARNKSTLAMLEYLQSRYQSPLVALAETYSRPVEELARDLACDREDAFKVQVEAMKASLPYWHQKQPMAVQIDSKGTVTLVIESASPLAEGGQPGDGAVVIEGTIAETEDEENQ